MSVDSATLPDPAIETVMGVDGNTHLEAEEKPHEDSCETEPVVTTTTDCTPDESGESEETSEVPEPTVVQKLYRHDCYHGCCEPRWSKFAVNHEQQAALEAEVCHVPIVQRYAYSRKTWDIESFTVNCPHMRAFLTEALANYQDLDPDLENWTFAPPYKALVHRWRQLLTLHREPNDSVAHAKRKAAVGQLVEFLEPILADSIGDLEATRDTGKIRYHMLWQIFPPGEIVLIKLWGIDTVCRVVKYRTRSAGYFITVEYVDWNGETCGFRRTEIQIPWYSGYTRVTSLPVYPLAFAEAQEEIKAAMMARGRRFQELRGYHFLSYSGNRISMGDSNQEPVIGRVVIDAYAYYRSNNIVKPALRALDGSTEEDLAEPETAGDVEEDPQQSAQGSEVDESETRPDQNNTSVLSKPAKAGERIEILTELSDEHCLLTTPWLIGFDLKGKQWGHFLIDKLDEIVWNDKAFDNLVLPGGEKELAWEFVESKARSVEAIDDFVPDKGRGIIILMFGPPGVGKTYTAEAVAEKARVPLYPVSAGMLGTSPEVLEPALAHALELCRLWNAMLLLDEADVFLTARLDDSFARNELVSIFLTKLEYYQGILFLTTNRFARMDAAFQSRVDLFLPYHDLTPAARRQVWSNFLEHFGLERFDVGPDDLDRLAELPLNGREIKNLLKSAQMLTARKGGKVTAERLYMLADKRVTALRMLSEDCA